MVKRVTKTVAVILVAVACMALLLGCSFTGLFTRAQAGAAEVVEETTLGSVGDTEAAVSASEEGSGGIAGFFGSILNRLCGNEDTLKQYEQFGMRYDENNELYWYEDWPVASFYDPEAMTMTDGSCNGVGVNLLAVRDSDGNVTGLKQLSAQEMMDAIGGMSGLYDSVEERAKADGLEYYEEDAVIKGLSKKELEKQTLEIKAKYSGKNALIKLSDYVIEISGDDVLALSSYCSSTDCEYGARVYADYKIVNEINVQNINSKQVDELVFEAMELKDYTTATELENSIKTKVAAYYGIDAGNLTVETDILEGNGHAYSIDAST